MIKSIAQMMGRGPALAALVVAGLVLASGAGAQAPVSELARAEQAVAEATAGDADQYAPELIALARAGLKQAQAASLDRRQRRDVPGLALRAAADADLARALSREEKAKAELKLRRSQVEELQRTLAQEEAP